MVEIIPKKIPQIPKWLNVLFYLSLVVLLFSIISYFNLTSSLNKSQKVLGDLKETLLKEKTPERVSLEKEVLNSLIESGVFRGWLRNPDYRQKQICSKWIRKVIEKAKAAMRESITNGVVAL